MMKWLKNIGFGLLLLISTLLIEFLVTLPFGSPWDTYSPSTIPQDLYINYLNLEFFLTALVLFFLLFLLYHLLHYSIQTLKEASILWSLMLLAFYLLIGFGNQNLSIILQSIGFYLLVSTPLLAFFLYFQRTKKYSKK